MLLRIQVYICSFSGTFLVPPKATEGKKGESEDTSRSGQGTEFAGISC